MQVEMEYGMYESEKIKMSLFHVAFYSHYFLVCRNMDVNGTLSRAKFVSI